MPNPIFNALNSGSRGGTNNFIQFMNSMRGQDPRAILNDMIQSGKITQQQLNAAQQQAQQISGALEQFKGMFGF